MWTNFQDFLTPSPPLVDLTWTFGWPPLLTIWTFQSPFLKFFYSKLIHNLLRKFFFLQFFWKLWCRLFFFLNHFWKRGILKQKKVHMDHPLDPPPPLWTDMDNLETPLPPYWSTWFMNDPLGWKITGLTPANLYLRKF